MNLLITVSSKHQAMRVLLIMLSLICLMLSVGGGLSSTNAVTTHPTVWSLVWSDEFDGPTGAAVDPTKWTPNVGGSGWGNHELEYYTPSSSNAYQSGGSLVIKAIKEHYTGSDNVTRE